MKNPEQDQMAKHRAAGQAMRDAGVAMRAAFAELSEALEQFSRSLYASVWHSYIIAGAPYGETRAGLGRWIREQPKVNK